MLSSTRTACCEIHPDHCIGGEGGPAGLGQATDFPIWLERVAEPGLSPARAKAGAHDSEFDAPALLVEERQLASGLTEAAGKPADLARIRPLLDAGGAAR
ncbi:hypothetical protein [Arenibaculum pallidiluteum]|uniref:hypothetical protein n=1 Tax=Arenibaculum pallidiluteum TaxID=2812559 RepID=UPI001A9722D9